MGENIDREKVRNMRVYDMYECVCVCMVVSIERLTSPTCRREWI